MRQKKIKNAGKENLIEKVKRKLRLSWVSKMRNTKLYPYCYRSYWHAIFGRNSKENVTKGAYSNLYFAARPNPGAGIGHQMANWIAGFWFSEQFGLKFAHIPFSNVEWEDFLGFYQDEKTMKELKNEGYLIKRIPKFDEANSDEVATIKRIIDSYKGKQVVFLAEQDQFYQEQFGVMEQIQEKFYKAPARKNDKLIYDSSCFNIAIHVRRGDIVQKQGEDTRKLSLDTDIFSGLPEFVFENKKVDRFLNVLKNVIAMSDLEGVTLSKLHLSEYNEATISIEWIFNYFRAYFSFESDDEDSYGMIENNKENQEFSNYFRKLKPEEYELVAKSETTVGSGTR